MTAPHALADAIEELRAHPLRTALQLSGILLGVTSVITALALVAGEREHDLKLLEDRGGAKRIDVRARDTGWSPGDVKGRAQFDLDDIRAVTRDLADRIESLNATAATFGRLQAGRVVREASLTGVLPEYSRFNGWQPASGRWLTWTDVDVAAPVAVLGDTVARTLFRADDPVGQRIRFRGQALLVVGVMEKKEMYWNKFDSNNALEWMNRLVLTPLTTVQRRHTGETAIHSFQVMARSAADVSSLRDALAIVLWRRHGKREDFEFRVRQEQFEKNQQASLAYNVVFFGVGAISLLVGGMVIMNILLASLSARIREIGLRKALGARGSDIFLQFVTEAVAVAAVGAVAGALLGTALTGTVADFAQLHAAVPAWVLLTAIGSALGTGLVFGIYPAVRAARIPPIEALRHE